MKKNNRTLLYIGLAALFLLLLIFSFLAPRPGNQIQSSPVANLKPSSGISPEHLAKSVAHAGPSTNTLPYPTLKPSPMKLARKELVRKDWNSAPDAFSYTPSKQSGAIGPNAVAYSKDKLYVLDNVGSRILSYDKDGKLLSTVPIPTQSGQDLFPNPSDDGSLILVDRMENKIYSVDGSDVNLMGTANIRTNTYYGVPFDYDPKSGELLFPPDSQDPQDTGKDIVDGKAAIRLKNGQWVALDFGQTVTSVEEVVTDRQGNTWVFYQLEGDFQQGRIARVDASGKIATMAPFDSYYTFDTTRRLIATDDGFVVMGGDDKEAHLRSYDYAGLDSTSGNPQ